MSKTYTTLSREGYTYLIGLIRNLANVSEGIDDLHLLSNGTFSSVKIDTLLNTLRSDCNEYTDRLVANLSRLELKIANDESEISQPNIMYLYKASGETSYSQYVVIEGVKILLGTCDIDMGNYYTITQADAKFVLKTDFDSLKTEVERKVNKTDIIDNLTSTDTDKPLSANQGKVLKDGKIDKTSIATTISDTPSDGKVASEKAIKTELDKKADMINIQEIKDADGKTRHLIMDIPSSHSISGKRTRLFISDNSLAIGLQIWDDNNTLEKDFRVPLTDTKNIFMAPKTFTPASTKVNFDNTISNYTIVNGMCYMNFWSINITSDLNTEVILDNLPKSKAPVSFILTDATGSKSVGLGWIDAGSQVIRCNSKLEAGTSVLKAYARFSYPIDINWIPS